MKRGKNILIFLLCLVMLGSLAYALYPVAVGGWLTHEYTAAAETFLSRAELSASVSQEEGDEAERPYGELYAAMAAYNEKIYQEHQSGLCDAWSYQTPALDLEEYGISDGMIGVISLPAMEVELPIYLGATADNMAKGAVHLSQTSLPLGGDNTNCVIAAHRGWYDAPFFRYIEKLQPGDEVYVTTLWETLTYRVTEIRIIEPNDIDQILIQDGRDMLTLLTCHPYASGGRYRYVVYCERSEE
jgi:sortase A